jgi:hypothetical protein
MDQPCFEQVQLGAAVYLDTSVLRRWMVSAGVVWSQILLLFVVCGGSHRRWSDAREGPISNAASPVGCDQVSNGLLSPLSASERTLRFNELSSWVDQPSMSAAGLP